MNTDSKIDMAVVTHALTSNEILSVSGGRINLRTEKPMHAPIEPGHGAAGYFLPEMEMDTGGPVFLPS